MAELPLVAIGMPTFNREWSLPQVLDSVLALEYNSRRIRICFVDNNSSDGTPAIIRDFATVHAGEYESALVKSVASNIPEARNVAFEMAEGADYIFFLDSDIVAPPDAVRRMLAEFKKDPEVREVALPWDARNSRKRAGLLYEAFRTPSGPHPAFKVGNGCNIVSMKAYRSVGGFNPRRARVRGRRDGMVSVQEEVVLAGAPRAQCVLERAALQE